MRWQALVALPEHIGSSDVGQLGEELRSAIDSGPAVLIADMTATVSCDHTCADAMARAYRKAAMNGTELRLVVPAEAVRNVLSLNGLGHLAAMYGSLAAAITDQVPGFRTAPQVSRQHDLLGAITRNLFEVGLSLQAMAPPQEADRQRLTQALERLDDTIREISDHVFSIRSQQAVSPPPGADGKQTG